MKKPRSLEIELKVLKQVQSDRLNPCILWQGPDMRLQGVKEEAIWEPGILKAGRKLM